MALRINIPPVTRILLAFLISLSSLAAFIKYYRPIFSYLTIKAEYALIRPWVFVTATFVEQNVPNLIISGVTIFYGGKYLERAWGSAAFGTFVLVVTLVPNVLTYAIYVVLFAITGGQMRSIPEIHGMNAIQASSLVAFKQLVPEHTVTIARGFVKVRVKHFPALFLLYNAVIGIIIGADTMFMLSHLGFLVGWTYLRFYKSGPDFSTASTGEANLVRGDASETFGFAYFFPDAIQTPIAALSDGIYNSLVAIKVCTRFSSEQVESGNEQAIARSEGGLPSLLSSGGRGGSRTGGKREEAERRRALALKALDQRLHAATNRSEPSTSVEAAGSQNVGGTGNDTQPA
ncbi:MAG: hypothetical protein M1812_004182 [Candelaria pacifica]|nr:MAG: hypothetical protein M1812_004182 [Candelaria pacifica]